MLGNDHFGFETPNVIDPGDLPPSRPVRQQQQQQPKSQPNSTNTNNKAKSSFNRFHNTKKAPIGTLLLKSTKTNKHQQRSSSDNGSSSNNAVDVIDSVEEYNQVRESAARLLQDIADLELTPPAEPAPYDPYDDDDDDDLDDDDDNYKHTTSTAHLYATSLLKTSAAAAETQPLSSFTRTIKLSDYNTSSKHLVRNRFLRLFKIKYLCIGLFAIGIIIGFLCLIVQKTQQQHNNNNINDNNSLPTLEDTTSSDHSVRMQSLVRILTNMSISSYEDLVSNDTPQYQAAFWIANLDEEQRNIPESLVSIETDDERLIQRYILAVFYFATSSSPDEEWKNQIDFISSSHECSWSKQVSIPSFTSKRYTIGVGCDNELNVRRLFLPDNHMVGTIPDEIGSLYKMKLIAFPLNGLYGTIPQTLINMQELMYLDLNYNSFSGTIPEILGYYPNLQILGLSSNILMGPVPQALGNLNRLKTLALDNNVLTGNLDFVRYLKDLEYLYMDRNKLYGQIHSTLFDDLPLLREIDVSENKLYGMINVTQLVSNSNLRVLDLAHNNFTGQFDPRIGNDNVIQYMSLRGNQFDGSIPATLNLLSRLSHLDMHGNNFSGQIPNVLGGMASLNYVFLGNNEFGPDIPPLSQLTALRELSLTGLGLTQIPSWLTYVSTLQLLDMSHNNIDGNVPSFIWNLPNLQYLILNDNELTGNIPSTDNGGQKLKFLALHHNSLSGEADHVCSVATYLYSITTDCSVNCSISCCKMCCHAGDPTCFINDTAAFTAGLQGSWEQKYTRSTLSFDPSILEETTAITIKNKTNADNSTTSVIP